MGPGPRAGTGARTWGRDLGPKAETQTQDPGPGPRAGTRGGDLGPEPRARTQEPGPGAQGGVSPWTCEDALWGWVPVRTPKTDNFQRQTRKHQRLQGVSLEAPGRLTRGSRASHSRLHSRPIFRKKIPEKS